MRKLLNVIRQSFKMSIQNIVGNKMRSFLTMLGIVIGVASVIALITIVEGATNAILNEFTGLGAGSLIISAPGNAMKKGLTEKDLRELEELEGVEGISPSVSLTSSAVVDKEVFDNISVTGVDKLFFEHNEDIMKGGREFNEFEMDGDTKVCIVDTLFVDNVMHGKKVLGQQIKLAGYTYTIVGIKKEDSSMQAMFSDTSDLDGRVAVPYKNALDLCEVKNVSSVVAYIEDGYSSADVEEQLRTKLNMIFNNTDNSFSVINMESLMDTMDKVTGMMGTLLAGIASIALLVGGIGIMNMMLVSVSERTKEIGLRKALGAEPSRIQAQFLIESIVLSVCGGILGVLFGMFIAFIGALLLDTKFTISVFAIVLGLCFSIAVGVIFGWMPAKRASELNPIDALRSE